MLYYKIFAFHFIIHIDYIDFGYKISPVLLHWKKILKQISIDVKYIYLKIYICNLRQNVIMFKDLV